MQAKGEKGKKCVPPSWSQIVPTQTASAQSHKHGKTKRELHTGFEVKVSYMSQQSESQLQDFMDWGGVG